MDVYVDWRNGFLFTGNNLTALTWMNVIGESDLARNKGVPANSRAGAPIEVVAMLFLGINMMKLLY